MSAVVYQDWAAFRQRTLAMQRYFTHDQARDEAGLPVGDGKLSMAAGYNGVVSHLFIPPADLAIKTTGEGADNWFTGADVVTSIAG